MAEYIECRSCTSPKCEGCNMYILATMLNSGKFDGLMDGSHTINQVANVVEVVRCKDCGNMSYTEAKSRERRGQ